MISWGRQYQEKIEWDSFRVIRKNMKSEQSTSIYLQYQEKTKSNVAPCRLAGWEFSKVCVASLKQKQNSLVIFLLPSLAICSLMTLPYATSFNRDNFQWEQQIPNMLEQEEGLELFLFKSLYFFFLQKLCYEVDRPEIKLQKIISS